MKRQACLLLPTLLFVRIVVHATARPTLWAAICSILLSNAGIADNDGVRIIAGQKRYNVSRAKGAVSYFFECNHSRSAPKLPRRGSERLALEKARTSGPADFDRYARQTFASTAVAFPKWLEGPSHGHNGRELTLILTGSLCDRDTVLYRGDIAETDERTEHQPFAGPGEDCICLAVTDAPLRFKSMFARLLQPLFGI